jgi:hypothetical protein
LSSENISLRWPTLSCQREGNSDVERSWRVPHHPHGVADHGHGWKLSSRKPGDPGNIRLARGGSVGEGAMPQVRRARFRGVRQLHSTKEAGEQRQRTQKTGYPAAGGVCGGKGADRGERQTVAPGPDTAPGFPGRADCGAYDKRHLGLSPRSVAWSSSSEVRAVCGSPARTDLREGRPARAGPIAINLASPMDRARYCGAADRVGYASA